MIHLRLLSVAAATALVLVPGSGRAEPNATTAHDLLKTLETGPAAADRLDAAKKLVALDPAPVAALAKFLERKHESTDNQRRNVLHGIRAEVPNRRGRFHTPGRLTKKQQARRDNLDWLARLVKRKKQKGLGEAIADVAAIRALAASKNWKAAKVIFDFAFSKKGIIYRDECGRYLRKMAPYSLPTLVRNSGIRKQRWKHRSRIRYATYQLERLDRQMAVKAIAATGVDERLRAELFNAFREVRYRDAARPILDGVNAHSPLVRAAARRAWMAYVSDKNPKKAPERKLKLPGGKETKKKKKLWFNYQDLAKNALYERHEQLFGDKPSSENLVALSKKLFKHYDDKRSEDQKGRVDAALAAAKQRKWDEAIPAIDRILAQSPEPPNRRHFADAYLDYAMHLEDQKKWREAAVAYGKAHAVAPEADTAAGALANRHYMLGRALAAQGKDATAEYRKALAIDPKHARANAALAGKNPDKVARDAGKKTTANGDSKWMLYLGLGGGAGALLLLVLALKRRA